MQQQRRNMTCKRLLSVSSAESFGVVEVPLFSRFVSIPTVFPPQSLLCARPTEYSARPTTTTTSLRHHYPGPSERSLSYIPPSRQWRLCRLPSSRLLERTICGQPGPDSADERSSAATPRHPSAETRPDRYSALSRRSTLSLGTNALVSPSPQDLPKPAGGASFPNAARLVIVARLVVQPITMSSLLAQAVRRPAVLVSTTPKLASLGAAATSLGSREITWGEA
ncbi:hypothetical protein BKA80DRAFT_7444 [Phyllosticta citrichinensis]